MEFEFSLPRGYVDEEGQLHREGRMRLATAIDEIQAMANPRTQENQFYLPILLLSRVILQLGKITTVTPQILERMFASDIAYLQEMYVHLNSSQSLLIGTVCPACNHQFSLQVLPQE